MDKQQRELILETMETALELELRAVRQAIGTDKPQTGAVRQRGKKRKSLTDLSVELLTDKQRLHVDELVDLPREQTGTHSPAHWPRRPTRRISSTCIPGNL